MNIMSEINKNITEHTYFKIATYDIKQHGNTK